MRICLVAPSPPPYGGVANWEQIVEREIKNEVDIDYTLINIATNKRPLDGRTILDRVFYSGYVMLKAYFKLRSNIRKFHPDVVHMTTSGGLGFYRDILLLKLLKRNRIPSVYHIHFGRTNQYKEEGGRCWKQIKEAVSLADATIVLDNLTYDILHEYSNNIHIINNPIDVNNTKKYCDSKIKDNKIIYLGWIIKAKGIEELLEAFSELKKYHHEYILELVGPGDINYIRSLKNSYDMVNVNFTGEVEHEKALFKLAESSIFILPSHTEGFPNVILEAMALKKCIIATSVGAIPEMLNGDAGLLIPPKDSRSIYKALNQLIENKKEIIRLGEKAFERVRKKYDVSVTMEKYRSVWESVIK